MAGCLRGPGDSPWPLPQTPPFLREVPDTFHFLRHVTRAILSVWPKCSHRCVSLKGTTLKPVQILKHTTKTQPSKRLWEQNGSNISRFTVAPKLITDRHFFWEELISNRSARRVNMDITITETDLREFQQNISHYRCRFSLEFQLISITDADFGLKMEICSVIMSATTASRSGASPNFRGHSHAVSSKRCFRKRRRQ